MSKVADLLEFDTELRYLPVIVSRLGDTDMRGWWRSHGMDATGEYVLADLFPKTWEVAGAEISVLSAAKRHHDVLPQRRNVVHLFGEPFPAFREATAWLAELKTGGSGALLGALRSLTATDAKSELTALLGESPSGERIGDTIRLGALSSDALADRRSLETAGRALAAAYVAQESNLCVPYFDLA